MRRNFRMLKMAMAMLAVIALSAPAMAGSVLCRVQTLGIDLCKDEPRDEPGNPIPEPSSALVFAAGLLVASRIARRRRA